MMRRAIMRKGCWMNAPAKRAERERQQQAKRQAAEAAVSPTPVDHAGSS
jgi:hypothetical protein